MIIKNQEFLKKENQSLVLELILTNGPISRAEIAKQTKMSPTSASRIVGSLLESGLIREVNLSNEGIGRKATYLMPDENSVISVGVELNQHTIHVGFMNFVGELIIQEKHDYTVTDPVETVQFISGKIQSLMQHQGFQKDQIAGVCIGLPGLIEKDKGLVKLSAQFDWKNVLLKEMFEKETGLSVSIDNELKLKALAEYVVYPSPEEKHMAMIGLGAGVGSALVTDGEIYRGEGNFSGEIGHTVVDPYGMSCPCGNFGCLQTYIAEKFLLDEASKTKVVSSLQELVEEADKGEKWARNILDKAVTYAAITINNVVCVFNPDSVVLAGTLIEDHPRIREQILAKCEEQIWTPVVGSFALRTTKLGAEGVVVGAAMSIQKEFIKNLRV
ncbi:ROK family protein [Virgibacillus halodenitrificans]|nr:ROK family protein [Virgibacillus halodenitrificans]